MEPFTIDRGPTGTAMRWAKWMEDPKKQFRFLFIYDRPDIARIIPKETKASETGQSKSARKYTYSEAYHEYDQEPLSHTQVLGANRFPCRFIILTVPRGVFAPRQWKEPITTT